MNRRAEGNGHATKPEAVAFCWSGGKDSALALHMLKEQATYEPALLLTTVTEPFDRVSMHGVRTTLLRRQAEALGLPLEEVRVPAWPTNAMYEQKMGEAFDALRRRGIRRVGFGDLFLQDLREYRDRLLERHGMQAIYPLWGADTRAVLEEFWRLRFRAVTVCVRPPALDATFLGKEIDRDFVRRLPEGVDACGENGEYHSFVVEGPGWRFAVPFQVGETVERDGFLFCDLALSVEEHSTSNGPGQRSTGR